MSVADWSTTSTKEDHEMWLTVLETQVDFVLRFFWQAAVSEIENKPLSSAHIELSDLHEKY